MFVRLFVCPLFCVQNVVFFAHSPGPVQICGGWVYSDWSNLGPCPYCGPEKWMGWGGGGMGEWGGGGVEMRVPQFYHNMIGGKGRGCSRLFGTNQGKYFAYNPKRRDFLAEWETLDISPNLEFTSETWSFRRNRGVIQRCVLFKEQFYFSLLSGLKSWYPQCF